LSPLDFQYDAMAAAILDGSRRDSQLLMKKISIQLPKLSDFVVVRLVVSEIVGARSSSCGCLSCNLVAVSCDATQPIRLLGAMVPDDKDGNVDRKREIHWNEFEGTR
jgi:hypothetical protein